METFFLSKSLLTVAKYRRQNILFEKERLYYYRYMLKLSYNLEYLGTTEIDECLEYVKSFEAKQSKRIKNGLFFKPKKMLGLVCRDAEDVLQGMRRWDGRSRKLECFR